MVKIHMINKTTGARLDFNDGGSYILSSFDLGQVSASRSTTQYINLIGKHVDSSVLGERDMSFNGAVLCSDPSDLRTAKDCLNDFVNPLHEIELHYGDYVIDAMPDSSVTYATDNKSKSAVHHMFSFTMTAYQPLFKYHKKTDFADSSVKGTALFPLIVPMVKGITFGYIPAITIKNPVNSGDVETGFILRFTALSDNVTNPKITNNKTNEFIEVLINLLKGDIVEISTVSGDKYAKLIRGEVETDIINNVTNNSSFDLALNVGMNDLGISNASNNVTNMKTSLEYVPAFMEIR